MPTCPDRVTTLEVDIQVGRTVTRPTPCQIDEVGFFILVTLILCYDGCVVHVTYDIFEFSN